ncbi:hypothetical protein CY35_13G059400 [Sphagnum magellanicum]|nr:hypothetical protein CY35_13G059400 [Sphagnum magellanicum]
MDEPHVPLSGILQQRLDPLTGQSEWVVVASEEGAEDGGLGVSGVYSEALAYTTYLDMLNDTARNRAYNLAIQKAVKGAHHVLDIGAGTGLLSMMAWRAICDHPKTMDAEGESSNPVQITCSNSSVGTIITACESYLPMVRLAHKLLHANKVGSGVRLIHKRSDEMEVGTDMPCRADLLISEILDSQLLGEGLIPTLRHAHEHLLTQDVRSVPAKATIYAQIVECNYLWSCYDSTGVEEQLADGLSIRSYSLSHASGSAHAMHVDPLTSQMELLSAPFKVFTFDFSKMPDEQGQSVHFIEIVQDGQAHGIVSWWVLQLDEEGSIFYSTAPTWIKTAQSAIDMGIAHESVSPRWCEHWRQFVFTLPGNGMQVSAGETVRVTSIHDAISVHYMVVGNAHIDEEAATSSMKSASSPPMYDRIGALGDQSWHSIIRAAVDKALLGRVAPLCLVLDDGLLMTMASASANSAAHVVAMTPGLSINCQSFENGTKAKSGTIRVLKKKPALLVLKDLEGRKVDVLMAEPYYTACVGMLPWRLLRFWYERTQLTPLLADNFTIIPFQGRLCGVAVFMPDLWHSRCCLGNVEGFDHSLVNRTLGACGLLPPPLEGPLLPYAVWQCGQYKELTDAFTLMTFSFLNPIEAVEGSTKTGSLTPLEILYYQQDLQVPTCLIM